MTVPDPRQDVSAKDVDARQALPGWLRLVGGIVILATAVVIAVAALWVFSPDLLTYSRRTEGLAVRILVTSLAVSSAGGLFMGAMTSNPSWLLALFVAGGIAALWLLIGRGMGPLMH